MKAEELRIGNLVDHNGSICTVECITSKKFIEEGNSRLEESELELFTDGYFFETSADSVSGILLTEEWIVNFGFKKVNTLHDGTLAFEGKPYLYFKNDYAKISTHTPDIIQVHQLQNLYYALNGEELKLK